MGSISQMENTELIQLINNDLAVSLPEAVTYDELHRLLAAHINDLIKNDFEKLVSCLYRIDVNEQKLKLLLQQYAGEDAGNIIALLIIERQEQKIKNRQQSDSDRISQRDNDINEEEKW